MPPRNPLSEKMQSLIITLFYLGNTSKVIAEELNLPINHVKIEIKRHMKNNKVIL
jgi:DNA-directed RNA polymerase specialized sigma24 family protein